MLEPPTPPDEAERIASLHRLDLLDSAAEERFDRITRVAALALDAPMAAVSLIDSHRQWFKSRVGMAPPQTSRRISFCGHAILKSGPFVVADALADPRFADNPLVLEDPKIRCYAGIPLDDDEGHNLAVLCVMDHKPRQFSARELETLKELAAWAAQELRSIGLDRAIREQREVKARIDAITESLVDGFLTVDQAGTVVTFNGAAERIFGRHRSTVVGHCVDMLVPEPYRDAHAMHSPMFASPQGGGHNGEHDGRHSGTGTGFDRDVVGLRGDGTVFPAELAVSTTMAGGEPLHLAIVRDITDRRIAEDAVRSSEKRYRALADLAPIGIFRADASGTCTYVNQRWSEITGMSREDALAGGPGTLHPEDAGRVMAQWSDAVRDGRTYRAEYRFRRVDGRVTWVSAVAGPQYADSGEIEEYFGVLQDITEQRVAEAALRRSEEIHRSVVTSLNEGILIHDREGHVVAANPAAERILGVDGHRLDWAAIERHRVIREDGTPLPLAEHPAVETLRTGRPRAVAILGWHRPDGEVRWISIQSQPLIWAGERRPWAVCCTFADITERLAIDQMKSQFVSLVSHELRTPLTSLRGALGLLAGGAFGSLGGAPQRMLDIAATNTDRLVRLVNDILDIERIESGSVGLARRSVDAEHLITQAIDVMQPMADKAEVRLASATHHAKLWVDPDRIIQTLTNLISNAVKFSAPGGAVTVATKERNGFLLVEVGDQGRGIPADKIDSIFDRFQQVDASDSRDKGGTGLGLAICRSIVEQHGGVIWARSTEGEGSVFTFSLPLVDEEAHQSHHHGPTVLIVDGDPGVATVIRDSLAEHGCVVAAPATTADAARLTATRLDAILVEGSSERLAEAVNLALDAGRDVTRALLIAHDGKLCDLLAAVLGERGVPTARATTVAEAIDAMEHHRPDLVVLDLGASREGWLPFVDAITDRGRCLAIAVLGGRAGDGRAGGGSPGEQDVDPDSQVNRVVELVSALAHRHVRELACAPGRS